MKATLSKLELENCSDAQLDQYVLTTLLSAHDKRKYYTGTILTWGAWDWEASQKRRMVIRFDESLKRLCMFYPFVKQHKQVSDYFYIDKLSLFRLYEEAIKQIGKCSGVKEKSDDYVALLEAAGMI